MSNAFSLLPALDLTGVGALVDVPANVAGVAIMATGGAMAVGRSASLLQHAASDDRVDRFDTNHRDPHPTHRGRDTAGRFLKERNLDSRDLSALKESQGLDDYEATTGRQVIWEKVKAHVEGEKQDGRFFNGLAKKRDGTWEGIEVKRGSARRTAGQADFDARVSPENPATVTLPSGGTIRVTSVRLIDVP